MSSRSGDWEPPRSALSRTIAPEIRDDRFSETIRRIAATPGVHRMLEIGSSSGDGSTQAFVAGALDNPGPVELHCIEVSRPRFEELVRRHGHHDFVHCHNVSSVRLDRFATEGDIARFCRGFKPWLRRRGLRTQLRWLAQDVEYVRNTGGSRDGIREIKEAYGIDRFDAVLIDGSEFTGSAILDDVYGATFLLLDDIRSFKNHDNYRRLRADDTYEMIERTWWLRNGYAVFRRRGAL